MRNSPEAEAGIERATPRSATALLGLGLIALLLFAAFVALGTWQVQRRSWKLDLIARVDQRLAAEAVPAPGPAQWPHVDREHDEYRRVFADGVLLNAHETLVQAVTEKGGGFWVMTPLQRADGEQILVNRGFVDAAHRDPATRERAQSSAPVHVNGLLRLSEPGGGFLRKNDPAAGRWYSRDVAAIAAAQGLPAASVAPYFIDADATPDSRAGPGAGSGGWPVGGLTAVRFHNSHLVYALTWYALALMVACAICVVGWKEWQLRRRGSRTP